MQKINSLMKEAISQNVFPGAVLLVSKGGPPIFFESYGLADTFSKTPMTKETVFDLASFTKPLATTLAVMKLVQDNRLDLSRNLESILPEFEGNDKGKITVKDLLCHMSGLTDHRPYYNELKNLAVAERKNRLRELLTAEPLVNPIGRKMVYSDLGFMILEWVVEKVSGIRLDRFVLKDVYKPTGVENLFFVDLNSSDYDTEEHRQKFAATELCPWRNILLKGAVHDDNAYVTSGIGGHAGLFGAAHDVNLLLAELLATFNGHPETKVFQQDVMQVFLARQKDAQRALGFDMPAQADSSCGRLFSEKTVGHLGFTGVSFWMDLNRSIIVILLTNRVHPTRDNIRIREFRPKIHNVVMESILSL
jgi:CubicO group peptidase (beta-lactamase class C family)